MDQREEIDNGYASEEMESGVADIRANFPEA